MFVMGHTANNCKVELLSICLHGNVTNMYDIIVCLENMCIPGVRSGVNI